MKPINKNNKFYLQANTHKIPSLLLPLRLSLVLFYSLSLTKMINKIKIKTVVALTMGSKYAKVA